MHDQVRPVLIQQRHQVGDPPAGQHVPDDVPDLPVEVGAAGDPGERRAHAHPGGRRVEPGTTQDGQELLAGDEDDVMPGFSGREGQGDRGIGMTVSCQRSEHQPHFSA